VTVFLIVGGVFLGIVLLVAILMRSADLPKEWADL